jgi:DNA primase
MNGPIPESIIDEVLTKTDIVELIGSYIPLKRAGANFRALCPFHPEKTPSFMVSAKKQIFHCFGCGAGGNAFSFLMRHERIEFPEAVQTLARKASVVLPESKKAAAETSLATKLYTINELAMRFYNETLQTTGNRFVRSYLEKRGVASASIARFNIGLAPDRFDVLLKYLGSKNITLSLMEKAGLVVARPEGGFRDRFRNRLLFPIFDIKNRVVGFGGRILPDPSGAPAKEGIAKYVNSPETPVYSKSNVLFGLNFSKDAIREFDSVIIVEGYMDFLTVFEAGVRNIVACSGTAFTQGQIQILRRYTHTVTLVYDADQAGQMATLRSLELFLEHDILPRVVSLPAGSDPDSFVRTQGVAKFREALENALDLFDYRLSVAMAQSDSATIKGKARIAAEMLDFLSKFRNEILKSEYMKRLASRLDVSLAALTQEIKKLPADAKQPRSDESVRVPAELLDPRERMIVKLLLEESMLIQKAAATLQPADFHDQRLGAIVERLYDLARDNREVHPRAVVNCFSDLRSQEIICDLISEEHSVSNKETALFDCIRRLKSQRLKNRCEILQSEIAAAQKQGDTERVSTLAREFQELVRQRSCECVQ